MEWMWMCCTKPPSWVSEITHKEKLINIFTIYHFNFSMTLEDHCLCNLKLNCSRSLFLNRFSCLASDLFVIYNYKLTTSITTTPPPPTQLSNCRDKNNNGYNLWPSARPVLVVFLLFSYWTLLFSPNNINIRSSLNYHRTIIILIVAKCIDMISPITRAPKRKTFYRSSYLVWYKYLPYQGIRSVDAMYEGKHGTENHEPGV